MRPETHLLRVAVLAGAVYLGKADWIETPAERRARLELIAEVVALEQQLKPQFDANVGMPEAGICNRAFDAVGVKVATMLRERKVKSRDVKKRLKLAAAIDKARGVS